MILELQAQVQQRWVHGGNDQLVTAFNVSPTKLATVPSVHETVWNVTGTGLGS